MTEGRAARHPAQASARAVRDAKRGLDPPDAAQLPEINDVWSRATAKYRVRAVVLLLVNVLLFGGLCSFGYWLRTGVVFAPAQEGYWSVLAETFQPSRDTSVSLGTLLTYPINVDEVPMQIVILGLLFAALASIPIVVAILYRFPASLPFLAGVAFICMMPWLAITLVGSCILASVKPFRFQFRYASALLGLVLVIAYFYGAARTAAQPVATLPNPAARIMFTAPWLLATVASCLLMGFVLAIARMVNYRPGAIAPLLALMFALPVALFEFYVGRDELHYRIIEHDYGPSAQYFAARDVSVDFDRAVRQAWEARPEPRPPLESVRDNAELLWALNLDAAMGNYQTAVAEYRDAAISRIGAFLRSYPTSRYAVNALYLMARSADMRVDQSAFIAEKTLRFYFDFPNAMSRHWWEMVQHNGSGTPMAAVALHRLALLDARVGDINSAVDRLRTLAEANSESLPQDSQADSILNTALTRKPAEATLGITVERHLLQGRRLLAMLLNNSDPRYGYDPIVRLMHFDPKDRHYRENLSNLIQRYPQAKLTDNIELEYALSASDLDDRIALLEKGAANHPNGDALPETFFRLGESHREAQHADRAREYYELVIRDHPDSIWRPAAQARLEVLPAAPVAGR